MSLQQVYQRFLAVPTADVLDPAAGLHYITTTKSIETADAIVRALQKEQKQLKKHVEKVLSSVETPDSLVLEVELEAEFLTDGSNFLPGLDETFIVNQPVKFPIIHFVNFENGLIKQVRLHWDQSSLLKQLNIIGRTGRNWPIRAGEDQCKLIARSVAGQSTSGSVASAPESNGRGRTSPPSSGSNGNARDRERSGSAHATRDPYASLHLGLSPEPDAHSRPVAPRARSTFSPPARDLTAIIGEPEEGETAPVVSPPKARSKFSRDSSYQMGWGEPVEEEAPPPKPVQKTKVLDPRKYSHFEFEDQQQPEVEPKKNPKKVDPVKHAPSWGFDDAVTPEKRNPRHRPGDVRHFGMGDEEGADNSPVRPKVNHPRSNNSNAHFNNDEAPSPDAYTTRPKVVNNRNQSQFSLTDESPVAPLSNVSNTMHHPRRDAAPHFEISDESPKHSGMTPVKRVGEDRKAAIRQNQSHWHMGDQSDDEGDFFAGLGAEQTSRGIAIAGNGQGNRKGTEGVVPGGALKGSETAPIQTQQTQKATGGNFWDF